MKLNTMKCQNAKPAARAYRLADGNGLSLLVTPTGSKLWQWFHRIEGKAKTASLGPFPEVGLKEARDTVQRERRAARIGEPPTEAKTFAEVCREHFSVWKVDKVVLHTQRVWARLEQDALPEIGHRQLRDIAPAEVVAMIRKVEGRGAMDVSRRLRQKVSEIFGYAIAMGYCETDPAARVGVVLKPKPKVEHMAKVSAAELPALVTAIDRYTYPVVRLALLWTLLTAARTTETRKAHWSEIQDGVWRIPAERMKMGREHIVPLSRQSQAVLDALQEHRRGDYLFPGPRRPTINQNAMIFALYDLGFRDRQTVHGFRGLFSTTLNEAGFNRDWIEVSLAHSDDSVRGAYNAAAYLEQRRGMLQQWADMIDQWRVEGMWG